MLIADAEVEGSRVDIRIVDGVIAAMSPHQVGVADINAHGGALLPGLHDHHLHLLATAAARESVLVGPPDVMDEHALWTALRQALPSDGWVRAVAYDVSVAGELDREALDKVRSDVPMRVQHCGGSVWFLNSTAIATLGLDTADHPGIDRDRTGRPTGRLWRADDWLSDRLGPRAQPDLGALGAWLSRVGITGVTDATPSLSPATAGLLAVAHLGGFLPQRITLLAADLVVAPRGTALGPAKIVVSDHDLPGLDDLAREIRRTRSRERAVAVHCLTRESLFLTLAALAEAGGRPGDRIEHAAVTPPEAAALAAELGVTVVTQPSMVGRRGDHYLSRVDPDDLDHLWPWRSLLDAGVPVAASSDAPYGDLDPWVGIRAAVMRRTASGRAVATRQAVSPATALAGWLTPANAPGGAPRRLTVGAPADLVLLDAPLADVLAEPDSERVAMTMIDGQIVHDRFNAGRA